MVYVWDHKIETWLDVLWIFSLSFYKSVTVENVQAHLDITAKNIRFIVKTPFIYN